MIELKVLEHCDQLRFKDLEKGRNLRVHSIFASVINLIGDDLFFSFISARHCLFPMSCRVSIGKPFMEYSIKEGMEVTASGNQIFIPKAELSFNFIGAQKRNLDFDNYDNLIIPKDLLLKIEVLKKLIWEKGCEYDLSTLVTGKYKNPYADLITKKLPEFHEAMKNRDCKAGEKAEGLAGCGVGLTPSSDDFLIGYMAAYLADSKAKGYNSKITYQMINDMGIRAATKTNTISGAFLKQCGVGLLSEDMTQLLCHIYSDVNIEFVRTYGQRLQSYGSTSGTDMLTGVVLAILNLNGFPILQGGEYFDSD